MNVNERVRRKYNLNYTPSDGLLVEWANKVDELSVNASSKEAAGKAAANMIFSSGGMGKRRKSFNFATQADTVDALLDLIKGKKK